MKTVIALLLFLLPIAGYSQLINSNQSTVGEFYDGKVKSIEINGAKVAGQLRLATFNPTYGNVNDMETITAVKNNSLFLNLGLTNTNNNILNLSKFDFKKNNGFTVGMTFQHSFSEIYLAKDSVNSNPHTLQSYLISLDYKQDKFENYDPSTGEISSARPDVISLRSAYSFYFFNYRTAAKLKYTLIPTISGKVNLKDYNATKLSNYLKVENTLTQDNIVYTSNSSYDGKYGVIDNNLKTAQLAFSLPIVTNKFSSKIPPLSPVPYVCYDFFEDDKPRFNGGFALGILTSALVDSTSKTVEGGTYKKFNVPSYLYIGADWNYQNGIGSSPNYYIAGSIKIQ